MTNLSDDAGYSLAELMIASLVMTMTVGGLFSALDSTQTFYENYADNSDMRQRARVALDTLSTELRYTGYDIGDLTEALSVADDNTIQFVADIDDGAATGPCDASQESATNGGAERTTYSMDTDTGDLTRTIDCYDGTAWITGVESSVVLDNFDASSLVFAYYDVTGTRIPLGGGTLDADGRSDVRSVEIYFGLIDESESQFIGETNTNLQLRTTVRLHNQEM